MRWIVLAMMAVSGCYSPDHVSVFVQYDQAASAERDKTDASIFSGDHELASQTTPGLMLLREVAATLCPGDGECSSAEEMQIPDDGLAIVLAVAFGDASPPLGGGQYPDEQAADLAWAEAFDVPDLRVFTITPDEECIDFEPFNLARLRLVAEESGGNDRTQCDQSRESTEQLLAEIAAEL